MALTVAPDFTDGILTPARLQQLSDAINERTPLAGLKTADQNVGPSNITLQDVTQVAIVVEANAVYEFRLDLQYSTTTAADIKTQFTGPAGFSMDFGFQVLTTAETWLTGRSTAAATLSMGGGFNYAYLSGTIVTGANAGTVQLQAAQQASTAVTTNVEAGTLLIAQRIS